MKHTLRVEIVTVISIVWCL